MSGNGSFVTFVELEDAQNDAKDSMARQVFGDGSGKLATFGAATAATVIPVSSTQYFVEGMYIDHLNSSGSVVDSQLQIMAVDDVAGTITVSSAITTVATDYATVFGNLNQELTGFGAVFQNNNVLYNVDRSVNKWFNPTMFSSVGAISEVGIQHSIDDVDRKAGGKTNFLLSSYGVRRAYQDLLLATKRTTDVMSLKGGYSALVYNDMPFATDKYCPSGTLYGLDLSTWALYHLEDWNWLDSDGAVLHRVVDRPVWEGTLVRYCDLGCSKPKGNFVMSGITEK